jgi:hypothetical protein
VSLGLLVVLMIAYGMARFHVESVTANVEFQSSAHLSVIANLGSRCGEMADAQDLKIYFARFFVVSHCCFSFVI